MVEGMISLVQVPAEIAGTVVRFLSNKYPSRETKKRGYKEVVFASNAIGEVFVKGLPAPLRKEASLLVEGVLLGLSGKGFSIENPESEEEPEEEPEEEEEV